jgi:hypothetical protein
MTFTYSKKQLTRDEVVAKVYELTREWASADSLRDIRVAMSIAGEVVEEPAGVIHHRLPDRCFTDENELSDYFYLIACDALALI